MNNLTFTEILAALKSDKYAGKIVSIQDFLHKEDELLQTGEVDRTLGNEKLSAEFKVEDLEALTARTAEEKYAWNDEDSADARAGDKYLDAEMLADYFLMRINAHGSISLVEANARLQAFDALDDISAHLIPMAEYKARQKEQEEKAAQDAPKSVPSTYIPYDIAGGPRAPARPVQLEDFGTQRITAVAAFQDAVRKDKIVAVSEFNRNVAFLAAAGGVPAAEYPLKGHQATKTQDQIMDGYSDHIYVLKDQLLRGARKPEVFVSGMGMAFAMASETLTDAKARLVVKAFDMAENRRNLSGLIRAPK
jgi:hypothetical protein